MLKYATSDFQSQFSLNQGTNVTPLGLGFSEYYPLSYIGLDAPKSLVTDDVAAAREQLGNALRQS